MSHLKNADWEYFIKERVHLKVSKIGNKQTRVGIGYVKITGHPLLIAPEVHHPKNKLIAI